MSLTWKLCNQSRESIVDNNVTLITYFQQLWKEYSEYDQALNTCFYHQIIILFPLNTLKTNIYLFHSSMPSMYNLGQLDRWKNFW